MKLSGVWKNKRLTLKNDSERSRTQLEGRIAEIKKLLRQCEVQSADMKNLLSRLDDKIDEMDQRKINTKPARPSVTNSLPTASKTTTQGFAKVLEQSISEQSTPAKRISELPATEAPEDSAAVREVVSEMLAKGMTVEEIARETGWGRGAILLTQQMMRRQNKRL